MAKGVSGGRALARDVDIDMQLAGVSKWRTGRGVDKTRSFAASDWRRSALALQEFSKATRAGGRHAG
jgi:hypothetical protein